MIYKCLKALRKLHLTDEGREPIWFVVPGRLFRTFSPCNLACKMPLILAHAICFGNAPYISTTVKIKTLLSFSSAVLLLQILLFSCYCPRFYTPFELSDSGGNVGVFFYDSSEPDDFSAWKPLEGATAADSIRVDFGIGPKWHEDVEIASNTSLMNMAMATQPCDPEYFERLDTILNLDVFMVGPGITEELGQSILGTSWFSEKSRDVAISNYHDQGSWGEGFALSLVLKEKLVTDSFALLMRIETDLDTHMVRTKAILWN